MMFRSTGLLEEHKAPLCTGGEVGNLRMQRRGSEIVLRDGGGGVDPEQTGTPDLRDQVGKSAGEGKSSIA